MTTLDPRELKRLDWLLSAAQERIDELSEWEQTFVNDLTERAEKYRERTRISERQWEVLEAINEKLTRKRREGFPETAA